MRLDRRVLLLAASLLLVTTWAHGAFAQARELEKANIAVTGDIKAIDVEKRTITIQSTHDEGVTYDVESVATIMKGGQKIGLGDLKVGWNVVVNGHDLRGKQTLTLIQVTKAPTP
jgi:Cu/Ag efflux protein CusF